MTGLDDTDDARASLDPARLTPVASLNRVRFVEAPGLSLPPAFVGQNAYALLAAHALTALEREVSGGRPVEAAADAAASHAGEVARRFGERLGWLLVTLRRGDPASRAARPDWNASYWQRWASLRTVFLAGGIMAGPLATPVALVASETLARAGHADLAVRVADWPANLPLLGAARAAPGPFPDAVDGVVLDFGGSYVKRAQARYDGGRLVGLRLLAPMGARWTGVAAGSEPTAEETRRLAAFMVATLAETWNAVQIGAPRLAPTINVSVASYVRDGQPLARQGGAYAALRTIADDLPGWLSARVSQMVGQDVRVRLLHDGTAAATALADEPDAAVITLGTALGAGYPPGYGARWRCVPQMAVEADAPA